MRSSLVVASALFTPVLAAQAVHVVGPGGFAQIQPAIAAAANGDVIVIQSGGYLTFTLNKDLTLTAAPGAVVDIVQAPFAATTGTVFQPPTIAKVSGIRFRWVSLGWWAPELQVIGGTVHFADCAFESLYSDIMAPPAVRVQNASVAMQRCAVIGGGPPAIGAGSGAGNDGLVAVHAKVTAVDCLFLGGNVHWDFVGHGGHAVVADDSDVHLANCIAVGGNNDPLLSYHAAGDGVHIETTSRVWLADCQLRGGAGHSILGGHALANLGAIAVQEARSSFFGGAGTPAGAPVIGPLVAAPLVGLAGTTAAMTIGAPWSVGYRTAPSTPVVALFADRLSASVLPPLAEPAWLPLASFQVAGTGVTGSNGIVAFAFAVPSTPALLHASVFVQGIAGATLPLEAAPPVGGVVR